MQLTVCFPVSNSYQSNGACSTTCSGYAFAVVQGTSCWCSNYIPASQSSTSSCGVACPGYPYENCGDQSSGLFGYVALGPSPSGTQGAASSSAASSSAAPSPSSNSPSAYADQAVSTQFPNRFSSDPLSLSFSLSGTSSVQGPVLSTLASPYLMVTFYPVTKSITSHVLTSECTDFFTRPECCDRAGYGHSLADGVNFLCIYSMPRPLLSPILAHGILSPVLEAFTQ